MNNPVKYIYIRLNRNQFGINDVPSIKNIVNIEHSPLLNVGDTIAPIVVRWMLDKKNIDPMKKLSKTKHLMAIGSIIGRGRFDTTVWGSGILKTEGDNRLERYKRLYNRKIDFRAVRGKYSREIVLSKGYECPEIYGDPAVLMPLIYNKQDENIRKEYDISIILHHRTRVTRNKCDNKSNYELSIRFLEEKGVHFIDTKTNDYRYFINEIMKSRRVISSSLHGIILAESYGVPAIFLNWGMDDQPTKFYDWYSSTGRVTKSCKTLEEAIGSDLITIPDISELQNNLINSFPYDLWEDS